MAKVETMEGLFLDELRDLYDGERQLTKALPKMAKACRSAELRQALESHLTETEEHVSRLEQIFDTLDEKASGKKCQAMSGLLKEGEDIVDETEDTSVRDAGIILACQKVEHYEIAGYGSAIAHAKILDRRQFVSILESTLSEEKNADRKLNMIAESSANIRAAGGASSTRMAGSGSVRHD